MHPGALTAPEQRVLGCLIEKRWTTPDGYPLSINSLRLACNQATNRDPVVSYDEDTVRNAAQRLSRYGLARLASGHTSRSVKYRHLAEEALKLDRPQLAVLAVLLLRGAQTPGELKARTERLAEIPSLAVIEEILQALSDRGYARSLGRRPGQKEDRFEHLLGGGQEDGGEGEAGRAAGVTGGEREAGRAAGVTGGEGEAGRAAGVTGGKGEAGSVAGVTGGEATSGPARTRAVEEEGASPSTAAGLLLRVERLERELTLVRNELSALRRELGAESPDAELSAEPPDAEAGAEPPDAELGAESPDAELGAESPDADDPGQAGPEGGPSSDQEVAL